MFDNRHHFHWRAEEESSWLDRLDALRLTPPIHTVRARNLSVKATRHTDTDSGTLHAAYYPPPSRDHQSPLDPFGHDD